MYVWLSEGPKAKSSNDLSFLGALPRIQSGNEEGLYPWRLVKMEGYPRKSEMNPRDPPTSFKQEEPKI